MSSDLIISYTHTHKYILLKCCEHICVGITVSDNRSGEGKRGREAERMQNVGG